MIIKQPIQQTIILDINDDNNKKKQKKYQNFSLSLISCETQNPCEKYSPTQIKINNILNRNTASKNSILSLKLNMKRLYISSSFFNLVNPKFEIILKFGKRNENQI